MIILYIIGIASIAAIVIWAMWELKHPGVCDLHIEKDADGNDWTVCTGACNRYEPVDKTRVR